MRNVARVMVSVCADRETAYICADRVRSVGRLGLQGIIREVGAIFCVKKLLVAVNINAHQRVFV